MCIFQSGLQAAFLFKSQGASRDTTASPKPQCILSTYSIRANTYDSDILLVIILLFFLPCSGTIELNLSDMVRGAKLSSKCTIELAKDWASPRFSIFRAKKMKGWWPLTRLKTAEDFEKEEKARQKAKKKGRKWNRKRKDKWSHMKQEDIQYTDSTGNTHLLMVLKKSQYHYTIINARHRQDVLTT